MSIIPDGQMENTHKIQYKLKVAMDALGNCFALSVLFTIGCIPVITAGASLAALYSMSIKYINSEDGPMIRGFLNAFKKDFKQATLAEIVTILAFAVEWGFIYMMTNYSGALGIIYMIAGVVFGLVICLTLPFLFPLIARFDNTFTNTIKNSFLLAISNLGSWLKVFLAWFAPIIFTVCTTAIFLNLWWAWLILIPGFIAYGTSFTMKKVFTRVADANEKKAQKEQENAETDAETVVENTDGANVSMQTNAKAMIKQDKPTDVKELRKNRNVNIAKKAQMVNKFNNPEDDENPEDTEDTVDTE